MLVRPFYPCCGASGTNFPRGEIGKNTDNYTETIWLNELNQPDSIFNYGIAQATYAPSSKLDWHIHPGGTNSAYYGRHRLLPGKRQAGTNSA